MATSVWRRRMRLSYERWRAIHVVCAAIVIAGSFVHVAGVSAYGNRLIGYDPDRRRLWLLGQRVHHGLAGALLAATGTLLMAHDWKDRPMWFRRGAGTQPKVLVRRS